jgi:hypothetical protein
MLALRAIAAVFRAILTTSADLMVENRTSLSLDHYSGN